MVVAAGPVLAGARSENFPHRVGRAIDLGAPPTVGAVATTQYLPLIGRYFASDYVSPFGVAFYYGVNAASGLEQMTAAGSRWTSTYFRWRQIEPTAPVSGTHTYDWSEFDTKVTNARAVGISIYAMFSWNPSWAAVYPGGPVTDTANLLAVVSAAAERYDGDGFEDMPGGGVVNHWAFYMEPDNNAVWAAEIGDRGLWGDDPEGYADLLATLATTVHAANPQAVVMPGAVAYDYFAPPDGDGHFKRDFLGRVIDRLNTKPGGAPAYIDAVPFHYYPISPQFWSDLHEKTQEIRGILSARGVGHLPLLVPEMGYWSSPTWPGQPAGSSPEQQARRLVQMYLHGISEGLTLMNWFQVFDGTCCSPLEHHGLFYGNDLNNPKPAYTAYGVLVHELTGAYYVGPVNSPGLQGYVFSIWHLKTKTAVWATQASANMSFNLTCLRRVDHMGNVVSPILDGNATWDKDSVVGQITLEVLQDQTLYVQGC
jgi:hypothetical protein